MINPVPGLLGMRSRRDNLVYRNSRDFKSERLGGLPVAMENPNVGTVRLPKPFTDFNDDRLGISELIASTKLIDGTCRVQQIRT